MAVLASNLLKHFNVSSAIAEFQWNLTENKYSMSSTKFVFLGRIFQLFPVNTAWISMNLEEVLIPQQHEQ